MLTYFDCWHPQHDHVSVGDVIRVRHANPSNAKQLLRHAVVPPSEAQDRDLVRRLDAVAGRVLHKGGSSWTVSSS
jgi:5'-methylthioadenosine phosphorylase